MAKPDIERSEDVAAAEATGTASSDPAPEFNEDEEILDSPEKVLAFCRRLFADIREVEI